MASLSTSLIWRLPPFVMAPLFQTAHTVYSFVHSGLLVTRRRITWRIMTLHSQTVLGSKSRFSDEGDIYILPFFLGVLVVCKWTLLYCYIILRFTKEHHIRVILLNGLQWRCKYLYYLKFVERCGLLRRYYSMHSKNPFFCMLQMSLTLARCLRDLYLEKHPMASESSRLVRFSM